MDHPLFCFFVSGEEHPVFPDTDLWKVPLSGKVTGDLTKNQSASLRENPDLTIGDYFLAAQKFVSQNNFLILKTGLAAVLKKTVKNEQMVRISLCLEKHGAFYHPMKVRVDFEEGKYGTFALNGAVSNPGLSLVEQEYQLLFDLNQTHPKTYLPRVFGMEFIETENGRIGFFLGEWFEAYKEFHVTEYQNKRQIVIWNSNGTCRYIPTVDALPIYMEIARILTFYYDLETFDQIFPWHHAAGDFIIRTDNKDTQVRLITVRGYSPLMEVNEQEEYNKVNVLPALLIFFLNLTLRIRLDRLDGTGRTVMLDHEILPAVIEGFFQALDEKSGWYDYGNLRRIFIEFLQGFKLEQILALMENIFEISCSGRPETRLIRENLGQHGKRVYAIFKNI